MNYHLIEISSSNIVLQFFTHQIYANLYSTVTCISVYAAVVNKVNKLCVMCVNIIHENISHFRLTRSSAVLRKYSAVFKDIYSSLRLRLMQSYYT